MNTYTDAHPNAHLHAQARCKVYVAGKASNVLIAEDLCFDVERGMITAGRNKMKVSGRAVDLRCYKLP